MSSHSQETKHDDELRPFRDAWKRSGLVRENESPDLVGGVNAGPTHELSV